MHRITLSLALSLACGIAGQSAALAQDYRGTFEQQMACTPDVFRLCSEHMPDANRITSCLRQNTGRLSSSCRAVFESNAQAPQAGAPQGRYTQPRRDYAQPRPDYPQPRPDYAQPRPDDDQW